ncbi:UNVERIFIED_CONTAM: hypothetical protein FKN15_019374 [Acipenser sinensis]
MGTYTEIARIQCFGAFYMDYLYTMENTSGKDTVDDKRVLPSPEEVAALEEFIPTWLTCVTVIELHYHDPHG